MAEGEEGGPKFNELGKTFRAQNASAKAHVANRGFLEKLAKSPKAEVRLENFGYGVNGDSIETTMSYGGATMFQSFKFDEKEELREIRVRKYVPSSSISDPAYEVRLERNSNNPSTFEVKYRRTNPDNLDDWNKRFKRGAKPVPQKPAEPVVPKVPRLPNVG